MLHLSLRCSTSSPSCSSSSCSSVHARTSARLRHGSLTVTSKGTYLPFLFAMRLSLLFPSIKCPYLLRQFFLIHVRIRLSSFPVCQLLPVLESLEFFSCPRGSVSPVSLIYSDVVADRPTETLFAPCAGERLSPYVALACIAMAIRMILS